MLLCLLWIFWNNIILPKPLHGFSYISLWETLPRTERAQIQVKVCTRKIPLPSLSVSMIKFRRLFLKIDHICPLIFMKLIKSCSLFRWNKLPAKQKHNLCSSAQQRGLNFTISLERLDQRFSPLSLMTMIMITINKRGWIACIIFCRLPWFKFYISSIVFSLFFCLF